MSKYSIQVCVGLLYCHLLYFKNPDKMPPPPADLTFQNVMPEFEKVLCNTQQEELMVILNSYNYIASSLPECQLQIDISGWITIILYYYLYRESYKTIPIFLTVEEFDKQIDLFTIEWQKDQSMKFVPQRSFEGTASIMDEL